MHVTLQAPLPLVQVTTLLPSPQFGDSETPQRQMDVKQSMNGTLYTYVKTNARSKLIYSFRLSRGKSLELRAFVEAFYDSKIRLTNHKGEVWEVYFSSNPFEFSIESRDAVDITLELEGERVSMPTLGDCE